MFSFVGGKKNNPKGDFSQVQDVRAYWEALREAGNLPRRDQLDPRGMASALDQVFLVEQIAPGHARIRLAGMVLNDLLGMEVRGMPLTALLDPAARSRLSEALGPVFSGTGILDLWLEAERGIGRPMLEARMTLLPLIGTYGEPNLALGCLCIKGEIGRTPRRFAISGLVREPLQTKPAMSFAEEEAKYAPPPPRGKPQLRLVSSRD